jgi:hypothetical protein
MENWVKREQRNHKRSLWRILTPVFLLLVALALVAYEYAPQLIKKRSLIEMTSSGNIISTDQQIRAFFVSVIEDLNLDTLSLEKQPLDYANRKVSYPTYRIAWPKDLPYVWIGEKANIQKAKYDDLTCEGLELDDNKGLVLWLIAPSIKKPIGELYLESSSRAAPVMSSIAFLFDNFAEFKKDEAQQLAWLDIPFGFILKPDQVPGSKLNKALRTSKGQCILQLPADRASWDVILNSHRLAKQIPTSDLTENNIRLILEQFPVLTGIYLTNTQELDRDLVRIIINQANLLDITYLYQNSSPDFADSLAYLKGLKIKKWANLKDLRGLAKEDLYRSLLDDTNYLTHHDKGICELASRSDNIEVLKSLLPLYSKLNIIIARPIRMAAPVDNL